MYVLPAGAVDETTVDKNDGHFCTCGSSHDQICASMNAHNERIRLQHRGAIQRLFANIRRESLAPRSIAKAVSRT